MAPPPHSIHPSQSLQQTSDFWYPVIKDLGWNRSSSDGPTHYHAALDGQTWLLISPKDSPSPQASTAPPSERDPSDHGPQGCVLALPYPNNTGWIGFFVVSSSWRGQGLGGALWRGMDAVWARNGTRFIGLDGVEEQVPTYTRRGFVDTGRIVLMGCSASSVAALLEKGGAVDEDGAAQTVDRGRVGDVKGVGREELRRLDEMYTGLDRRRYWVSSDLLDREDVFGFAHYVDAQLNGFVLVRGCEEGHRIGPLFAPSVAVASQLLLLAMQHPTIAESKGSLIAEVFGANAEARKVFEGLGWSDVGMEYHRMWYEGRVPKPQRDGGLGTKGMFAIFDAACG